MRNQGSFNRLEWILGILLIILLIIVVVLSVVFWFRPEAPGIGSNGGGSPQNSATTVAQNAALVGPTPVYEGNTARVAFVDAQRTALTWQADAQLLNASATWPQGAAINALASGEEAWTFTFYSQGVSKTAVYTVVDRQVTFIGESNSPTFQEVRDSSAWQIDSNEAIRLLLEQGGSQFLEQEQITILTMVLMTHTQTPSQQMEWFLSLIGTESGNSIDLRINAASGELLEIVSSAQ